MKKILFTLGLSLILMAVMAKNAPNTSPAIDTAGLEQYAGVYNFDGQLTKATVIVKENALFSEVDSYGSNKLIALPDADTFQSTSTYGSIYVFQRDAVTKMVTGVILKLMGQEIMGKKAKP
jgi:hypothetical protein